MTKSLNISQWYSIILSNTKWTTADPVKALYMTCGIISLPHPGSKRDSKMARARQTNFSTDSVPFLWLIDRWIGRGVFSEPVPTLPSPGRALWSAWVSLYYKVRNNRCAWARAVTRLHPPYGPCHCLVICVLDRLARCLIRLNVFWFRTGSIN